MAEYIEREAAVKAFNNFDAGRADSPPFTLLTPEEFAEYLYELPTIDAVPIIRCKDCAYFHPYPFEPEYGSCKYHLGPDLQWEEKKETDYCSDAERLKDVD